MESVDEIFDIAEDHMDKSVQTVESELASIRTGKASPVLLENIKVEYYGSKVPLKQLANIAVPDPGLITVQPWEKQIAGDIVTAIQSANVGLNPQEEGGFIRIPIPSLTEERRKELSKTVDEVVEQGRVAIRNIRRDANDKFKKLEKAHEISEDDSYRYQDDIQKKTDEHIETLDEIGERKKKEILEF